MRVLLIPSISSGKLIDNREYIELFNISKAIVENGCKAFFYAVVPSWARDGLLGHDRLHYILANTTHREDMNDAVGYSSYDLARYFSRCGGVYIIDAVITNHREFGNYIGRVLGNQNGDPVPVVLRNRKGKVEGKNGYNLSVGIGGCYNAFMSNHHRSEIMSMLSLYLSPASLRAIDNKSFIWPISFQESQERKSSGPIVALCAGNSDTDFKTVLGVCRRISIRYGISAKLVSRDSESAIMAKVPGKDVSYLSGLKFGLHGTSYKKEIMNADLFVSGIADEAMLCEEIEQLVSGQIVVFPRKDWICEVVGTDYPFMYSDNDEIFEVVSYIIENHSDAKKKIRKFVDQINEKYIVKSVAKRVWSELESIVYGSRDPRKKPAKRNMLRDTVSKIANGLGNEFYMKAFLDILEEHLSWLKPWGHKGTLMDFELYHSGLPTLYDLRSMLAELGWNDQCDSLEMKMVRK